MFRRALFVQHAVGSGVVVGHGLEGAGVQHRVEPLPELVHGTVGGLVGNDDLVELPDGGAADGAAAVHFAVDGIEVCHVVLEDCQQVVGILSGAGRRDCGDLETLFDEGARFSFVQLAEALDDACLDGPAPVRRRQSVVCDVGLSVEPLLARVVILGEVAFRLRLDWGDEMPGSGSHGYVLSRSDAPETTGAFGSRTSQNADGSDWLSEVGGLSSFWHGGFVHAIRAFRGADVAEAAFLP